MEVHETANNKKVLIMTTVGSTQKGTVIAADTVCIAFVPLNSESEPVLIPWHIISQISILRE